MDSNETFIQNLTGNIIEIDVEKTDTVQKVKEYVEEKAGIPPKQQRLIFGGKAMYALPFLVDIEAFPIRR